MYQGGGGAHMGTEIYQTNEECFFNSYIVSNCTFEHNHAIKGVGGGITWYAVINQVNHKLQMNLKFTAQLLLTMKHSMDLLFKSIKNIMLLWWKQYSDFSH